MQNNKGIFRGTGGRWLLGGVSQQGLPTAHPNDPHGMQIQKTALLSYIRTKRHESQMDLLLRGNQ